MKDICHAENTVHEKIQSFKVKLLIQRIYSLDYENQHEECQVNSKTDHRSHCGHTKELKWRRPQEDRVSNRVQA